VQEVIVITMALSSKMYFFIGLLLRKLPPDFCGRKKFEESFGYAAL
jgi:hypothetical protein